MGNKKVKDLDFERWHDGRIKASDANRPLMKELLDDKGPGFCLAKWTQVTMHLGVGLTHSCHHPGAHKIPVEELKVNPGALHNTKFKKERRKEMLNGERPAECDFCWRIEDNTRDFSDRVYKSLDGFSIQDHDRIKEMTGDEDIFPRYVEVSFSNVCNFKCSYCGPTFSSKWWEEINEHGHYTFPDLKTYNSDGQQQLKNSEDNPYTEAFWKWFPEAVTHMHTFRITGGEPLLSKHTIKVIDYLLENPNPELEFAINTNGNPPDAVWNTFVEKIAKLEESNAIKKFTLFTSAESAGAQAEYSRYGLDWEKLKVNMEMFLQKTKNTRVQFMSAFNILSLPTFKEFLEYILLLKQTYNRSWYYKWLEEAGADLSDFVEYGSPGSKSYTDRHDGFDHNVVVRVGVDIPYVRHPEFLDVNIATMELVEKYLLPSLHYMYRNGVQYDYDSSIGFESWESAKLKRILSDILGKINQTLPEGGMIKDYRNPNGTTQATELSMNRARFYLFVKEYDRRRNTNFLETFPEMTTFYKVCKREYQRNFDQDGNQISPHSWINEDELSLPELD